MSFFEIFLFPVGNRYTKQTVASLKSFTSMASLSRMVTKSSTFASRINLAAFAHAPWSISTPTPLAPYSTAAAIKTRPSLHPKSKTTDAELTFASFNITLTIFAGVALIGPR
jgi:hypothetical protein